MLKLFILLALGLESTPLRAYGPCDEDAEKLCDDGFHGETIKTCLHKNIDKLSPECKAFVKSREGKWSSETESLAKVKQTCAKETDKFCPEAKDSRKPFVVCIMSHDKKISDSCKTEMNRHIKEHLPNIKPL